MKLETTKTRIKVIAASESKTKYGRIRAKQKLDYLKNLPIVRYSIFCKAEQRWNEYDLTDYECEESGTDASLFLRCHICNDYWIHISSEGVRDGFRYPDDFTNKEKNKKPNFKIFVTKDEYLK